MIAGGGRAMALGLALLPPPHPNFPKIKIWFLKERSYFLQKHNQIAQEKILCCLIFLNQTSYILLVVQGHDM